LVKVSFSSRILSDDSFVKWALEHPKKAQIFLHLIRIKSVCKDCDEHNVILGFDFQKVKGLTGEHWLRGAFKEECPNFPDGITDEITRRKWVLE
jgi:hypothetical protein